MSNDALNQLPPRPPRIPLRRRVGRAAIRWWPLTVWLACAAGAAYLYTGLVDPGQALAHEEILEVRAAPSVAGRVATLAVELGATVSAGDVVATLDTRDLEARLRFARTRLERSRTRIAAVRAELEAEMQEREAQAAARRTSYETEGRRIRAAIQGLVAEGVSDRAELDALTPQIERLRPLAESNLITRDRLEGLLQERAVLEARLTAQADRAARVREELALWADLAPAPVAELDIGARLVPYELTLEAEEARVAELLLEREKHNVLAPAAGTVNRISARPGEWCAIGQEVLELVVSVPHRVVAYVPGEHARDARAGDPVTLRPRDRAGDAMEGLVVGVGPRIELVPRQLRAISTIPEWGRRVSIQITNPEPPLPGEVYTVRFR